MKPIVLIFTTIFVAKVMAGKVADFNTNFADLDPYGAPDAPVAESRENPTAIGYGNFVCRVSV